nr:metalloregulator ArsR/SmtB family transcription factor [Sulfuricystis multivorans]
MDAAAIIDKLAALAQENRLAIFRLLVATGPEGLAAGAIADALGLAAPTLSFHLAHLARAGLVSARQEGRFIYYSANFAAMDALIAVLTENCCQGGGQCLPKTAAAAISTRSRRRAA